MRKSQNFWDKNAERYDRFMRKDAAAYERLYELLRPVVRHRTVLELAAGTGLIAKNIVNSAAHIEATDADDRGGEAGQPLRQAAFLRAGYVPPPLRRRQL